MAGVLRGDTAGTLCGDGRRSRREPARSRRSPGCPLCSRSCVWRGRLAQTRGGRQTEDPAPQAAATALRAPGRPVLPSSCPRPRIGHQWALGGTPCWRRPTQWSEKRSARSLSAGRVRDGGAVTPVPRGPLLRACGDATLPVPCVSLGRASLLRRGALASKRGGGCTPAPAHGPGAPLTPLSFAAAP